jgi:hypothetical protein
VGNQTSNTTVSRYLTCGESTFLLAGAFESLAKQCPGAGHFTQLPSITPAQTTCVLIAAVTVVIIIFIVGFFIFVFIRVHTTLFLLGPCTFTQQRAPFPLPQKLQPMSDSRCARRQTRTCSSSSAA